ncbi:MAG: hypothetical protein KatS3mg087_1442 [Patescibacteria group bacterium]|nr:MAG: hypothetical protein KatS3mg087_1442 [Patescibacteria group bacterium]
MKAQSKFITIISVAANLILGSILTYNLLNSGDSISPSVQYPLLDFSRNYIDQKYFIVNFVPLRKELDAYLKQQTNFKISLYFEYLHTGSFIWLNQDLRLPPASLTKLPVAMTMLKEVELGTRQLSEFYTLSDNDKDSSWGELYRSPTGTKLTWESLLQSSLRHSDNTAHQILYKTIQPDSAKDFGVSIGVESLFDSQGNTSVREMARIFRSLYTASYLNRTNSHWVLKQLQESQYTQLLRHQLSVPASTKFGIDIHTQTYNEAGIIYLPNSPFLISILMQSKENSSTENQLLISQKIMTEIRDTIIKYINSQLANTSE